jgi:predicted nucleic acid-binding protein
VGKTFFALPTQLNGDAPKRVGTTSVSIPTLTNILSELRRPKPEAKVLAFVAAQPLELLFVSSVTFAEIRFGVELLPDQHRRADLTEWLTHKLRPMFEQREFAVSEDVMFK